MGLKKPKCWGVQMTLFDCGNAVYLSCTALIILFWSGIVVSTSACIGVVTELREGRVCTI